MDFKSLAGQDTAKRILIRTVDRENVPNSFLFYGPEGVGKWGMAVALTAYLNCRSRNNGDSCGTCPPCRQIRKLQYPNLLIAIPTPPSKSDGEELDNYWEILNRKIAEPYALITGRRQMSIPVNTVREIRKSLGQKSTADGRRVVIIEQMDRMLAGSADALLKLVEEPPPRTVIIITTSRPDRIPATIVSRCRRVRFSRLSGASVREYLVTKGGRSEKDASLLAKLCHGSLGTALYLTEDDNAQDREVAKLLFKGMFQATATEVASEASELLPIGDRFRLNRVLAVWQTLFRDLICLHSGARETQVANIDFVGELERLAGRPVDQKAMMKIPALIGSVMEDIDLNVEPQTAVAALIIDMHKRIIPPVD
jgi:DNA polymerase III subunit delta'